MLNSTLVLALLLTLQGLLSACGSYETLHIKDYKIYVHSENDEVRETVNQLADSFNEDFGGEAIAIVNEPSESNSDIRFISGLKERENKLGLGQWLVVTSEEGQSILPGREQKLQKNLVYSMEIDFDLENFTSKMDGRNNRDGSKWAHLYHLFCHEVGHGLHMGHEEHKSSVMYYSIPEGSRASVDFEGFFERARDFFKNNNER